jgi:hypothetical protein
MGVKARGSKPDASSGTAHALQHIPTTIKTRNSFLLPTMGTMFPTNKTRCTSKGLRRFVEELSELLREQGEQGEQARDGEARKRGEAQ